MASIFDPLKKAFGRRRNSGLDLSQATPAELAILSRMPLDKKERDFIEVRLGVPIHKFADYTSYLETGHKRVWATYRACKLISAVIVSATYKMVKGEDDDSAEVVGAGFFIDKPNPFDSWEELIEMWAFHMELVGNAYWLKDEIDLLGRPKYLYPLLPQHVKIIPDKTNKVAKYVYKVGGQEIKYDADEIIHFRATHPNSLHFGMGSIEPSESLYSNYINANTLEEKFMENGAQVSGILVKDTSNDDDVDPDEWEAMKKKFNLQYSGKKNAGKTAFLNGKWQYHKMGLSMQEMQSIEKEKWSVEQIFLNHGVPLSVAGIEGAANYATSRQDEINFRRYKVVPMIDALIGKLNSDGFFRGRGQNADLKLTYEMSGLIDVEQIIKDYGPLVEMGAMTRNELREMCGLSDIEDNPFLDQFMVSANIVPIEMAGFSDPLAAIDAEEKSLKRRKRRAIDLRG